MTTSEMNPDEPVSPTRVWRMVQCPASVLPRTLNPMSVSDNRPNAGTLAHRGLELWIKQEGYKASDPRAVLSQVLKKVVADANSAPPEWIKIRSRFLARATELGQILHMSNPEMHCEEEIWDHDRLLSGVPDIVALSADTAAVIDLKSGAMVRDELTPWMVFQLTIYAHLVHLNYGQFPKRTAVFSLGRGYMPAVIDDDAVKTALVEVEIARRADRSIARPAPETCRYCPRRFDCEAHWTDYLSWPSPDCVEGRAEQIERGSNGLSGIRISTSAGNAWVSEIPTALVNGELGQSVRLVRLWSANSVERPNSIFKWTNNSAIAWIPQA